MNSSSLHRFGTVALAGLPNAGKSTLMNTMVGEKVAIVSSRPQTTRNRISGILTSSHCQVVFLDTPGLNRAGGKMNELLNMTAREALYTSDAVVLVVDPLGFRKGKDQPGRELSRIAGTLRNQPGVVLAVNKTDLVKDKKRLLPVMERLSNIFPDREIFPVSARTGQGCDDLLKRLVALLPEGEALYPEDQISTLPMRFMAAEILREKLFALTRSEIPYGLAVEIESWQEEEGLISISALIYVLKASHKSIVIGKKGRMLREAVQKTRLELEEMTGKRVFLETWVKVSPGWNENRNILSALGLG
ncbi:MAG: GTPase Era [Desulfonatronovibrionaceae bacterium]